MDYTVIRSKRKTIAVEITREGGILVRAPLRASRREVAAFVGAHSDWIARKLSQARERKAQSAPRQFREGETFLFLGEPHRLRFTGDGDYLRRRDGEFLLGSELSSRAASLFRTWYRARAREILEDRLGRFAHWMGVGVKGVRITDAKERWGSCNVSGGLNFAWRLVMAPPEVIDYVIVHELAHLVEMNHSRRFWERVGSVLPDYAVRRKWLRENGHRLSL